MTTQTEKLNEAVASGDQERFEAAVAVKFAQNVFNMIAGGLRADK